MELAPYTWEAGEGHDARRAVFTKPPIADQMRGRAAKGAYLSAITGTGEGVLGEIDIQFMKRGERCFSGQGLRPRAARLHEPSRPS